MLQYIEAWVCSSHKQVCTSTNPITRATRLLEDLRLDYIAREELFNFLDKNCTQSSLVRGEGVIFNAITVGDILDYYEGKELVADPLQKPVFLFPGQGVQKVGMANDFIVHPSALALFQRAQQILGYDLLDICTNGPQEKFESTIISQLAIFVTSLAAVEAARRTNPVVVEKCAATAGLSLGEYTALVFAGALSFEDALRLIQLRAEAMQSAVERSAGCMISILGCSDVQIQQLLDDIRGENNCGNISVANYLCPGNRVLSGDVSLCGLAEKLATSAPYHIISYWIITVAGAFHSELMRSASAPLQQALEQTEFLIPRIPMVCNLTGNYETSPQILRENLIAQLVSPVQWEHSMRLLLDDGYRKFCEIGPGTVLVGLMRHILKVYDTNVSSQCQCSKGA